MAGAVYLCRKLRAGDHEVLTPRDLQTLAAVCRLHARNVPVTYRRLLPELGLGPRSQLAVERWIGHLIGNGLVAREPRRHGTLRPTFAFFPRTDRQRPAAHPAPAGRTEV